MIAEIVETLRMILIQGPIDKVVKEFSKRLHACVVAKDGHF